MYTPAAVVAYRGARAVLELLLLLRSSAGHRRFKKKKRKNYVLYWYFEVLLSTAFEY